CGSSTPSDDSQNTMLCYPGYWTPTGQAQPIKDYFNKYIVNSVSEYDPTTQDTIQTTYTPGGSPAWHYDDNPLVPTTPTNERTWDQWRGFGQMTVSTGTAPDPVTKGVYRYLRGMDGDYLTSSTTRSVSVTDSRGDPPVKDYNQYYGMTYETQVFNGTSVVTDTVTDPWTSAPTATHALTGLPTLYAFLTGTADTKVYTPLANGSTRESETDYTHDAYGRITKTNDQGDVSTTADDLCTTASYADSSTAWILDKPAETKTVSVNCSTTPAYPANAVSDTLIFYDGSATLGTAPTVGDATMTQQAVSYTGSTPTYATMSKASVDEYGRATASTDPDNRTTHTIYTPATGAQPTSIAVYDPLNHKTTTTFDPLRDLPLAKSDPAGYVTSEQYDSLGRMAAVFKPGITPAVLKYTYTISNTAVSFVDTYALGSDASGYHVTETLYDAMLRAFETQTQTPDNSRNITDTYYNSDGWVSESTAPYNNSAAVSTTPVQAQAGQVPSATGYNYDGDGRKSAVIAYANGAETWRTTYTYGGNFTTTIPPAGATATTSVIDARGRQSDLIQYHAGVPTDYVGDPPSDYSDTTYTYDPAGKPATETDAAGNQWSWTYNLLGQKTDTHDPDAGHSVSTYDNAGQLITTTDARGKQTTNTYDLDGRATASYDTTLTQTLSSSNQLSKYVYDSFAVGYPTSTTSYSNGDTYTSAVTGYNALAKPMGSKVTLTGEGTNLVPSTGYTTTFGYTLAGLLDTETDPASGGLNSENINYAHDLFGETLSVQGSGGYNANYIAAAGYSEYGQPVRYMYGGAGTDTATVDMTYDPQIQALTEVKTSDSTYNGTLDDLKYTFGNAAGSVSKGSGLLTEAVDTQNAASTVDTQCFTYDYATRLQQAWSATDQCAAIPAPGNSGTVGGPLAPYWQSWTYDAAGDRRTQADHDTAGNTANDTTTTYNYPTQPSATDQPHTLTGTTASGPNAAANTATYGYDTAGNTTSITGGALGNQSLAWTTQGKLQSDTTGANTTSYVYDATGNTVVRRDPGTTVFYMGDEQLTLNTATGTVSAVRYYSINGATIAVRNSTGGYSYLIPDRQGTDQLAINATTLAPTCLLYTS
ncbi:RHS repeat protein, partial [Actinocrinis puniceicyclus]